MVLNYWVTVGNFIPACCGCHRHREHPKVNSGIICRVTINVIIILSSLLA